MLKCDSKKIIEGDTFIAIKGENVDGHNYINEAINNGAKSVIAEYGEYSVDTVIVKNTKEFLTEYLKVNKPNIRLIGVTGTNGKTTTCYLIYQLLNLLDVKCAYIGTLGFYIEEKMKELNNTTPGSLEICELMNIAYNNDCKYIVMEVSSQALSQKRCDFLTFDYAIFTNLTREHLDYHKTMEEYAKAKKVLFEELCGGINIINNDSEYKEFFMIKNFVTYGFSTSDYNISNQECFKINEEEYKMSLIGKHNVYNMSCAIILLKLMNFDYLKIQEAVLKCHSPKGRMEMIHYKTNKIIIDYAHTPDAVLNIIKSIEDINYNKLIVIIGCGGNRDSTKRPIMGSIATNLANHVIFTSDNPRNENEDDIIKDILLGVDNLNYEIIVNRANAIKKGIQLLSNNDILMVLGKGHETYQIIKDKKIYFSDSEEVLKNI